VVGLGVVAGIVTLVVEEFAAGYDDLASQVDEGITQVQDWITSTFPVTDGQIHSSSVGAVAVAASNPDIVYIGTGEADMRSDISQGIGMFRSDDGGQSWSHIGLADTQQIGKILVSPRDPNLLLVAALGHPYGPNAERGVFRSPDGGKHWTKTLYKDADTGAIETADDGEASGGNGRIAFLPPAEASHLSVAPHPLG